MRRVAVIAVRGVGCQNRSVLTPLCLDANVHGVRTIVLDRFLAPRMDALHRVIREAREQGVSMRECARILRMSKSDVQRHSRFGHECMKSLPVWGSPEGWLDGYRAVWAHDPEMLAAESVPFAWEDDGAEGRIIRLLEWKVIKGRH